MASAQVARSSMTSNNDTEPFAQCTRRTRDGRVVHYRLKVLQHPEIARACGSGAKSSADRRPVDPPPIVQLKICEGSVENDVTASWPANFFIFVSIEHAKAADPQAQNAGAQLQPVLTGTNVCSMTYLERPSPAGYFIFPDISVRHEGIYRLVFDLYEDAHDQGIMDTNFRPHSSFGNAPPLVKVMDVKSSPFDVFSAKRFPGLKESTTLSRTFAEQGVRVRIRKETRMRKRDTKGGAHVPNDDDAEHEPETPEPYKAKVERPRSPVSIASRPGSRRSSVDVDTRRAFAPSPIAANTSNGIYPPQMSAWQAPAAPQAQHSYMHPPAPPSYSQSHDYAPSYPSGQQNGFAPPQYSARGFVAHSRNASQEIPLPPTGPSQHVPAGPQYMPSGQPPSPYPTASYHRPMGHAPVLQPIATSMHHQQGTEVSPNAAFANSAPSQSPLRPNHAMYGPMSQPLSAVSPRHHSFSQQASSQQPQQAPLPHVYPQYAPVAPPRLEHAPQPSGATKRTYSSTFESGHLDARLQHGERPISPVQGIRYSYPSVHPPPPSRHAMESEHESNGFDLPMTYRRADGTEIRRKMPPGL